MGDRDRGDDAPLADLVDAIGDGGTDDDVWERLAAAVEDDAASGSTGAADDADPGAQFSAADAGSDDPIEESRDGRLTDQTPAWDTISNTAKIVHGYLTVLSLGAALVIFAAAVAGVVPRRLWILSLPPFALGIVLFIPILAWQLGVWDPSRIA